IPGVESEAQRIGRAAKVSGDVQVVRARRYIDIAPRDAFACDVESAGGGQRATASLARKRQFERHTRRPSRSEYPLRLNAAIQQRLRKVADGCRIEAGGGYVERKATLGRKRHDRLPLQRASFCLGTERAHVDLLLSDLRIEDESEVAFAQLSSQRA